MRWLFPFALLHSFRLLAFNSYDYNFLFLGSWPLRGNGLLSSVIICRWTVVCSARWNELSEQTRLHSRRSSAVVRELCHLSVGSSRKIFVFFFQMNVIVLPVNSERRRRTVKCGWMACSGMVSHSPLTIALLEQFHFMNEHARNAEGYRKAVWSWARQRDKVARKLSDRCNRIRRLNASVQFRPESFSDFIRHRFGDFAAS